MAQASCLRASGTRVFETHRQDACATIFGKIHIVAQLDAAEYSLSKLKRKFWTNS
jgi:hypothetical protein